MEIVIRVWDPSDSGCEAGRIGKISRDVVRGMTQIHAYVFIYRYYYLCLLLLY